MIEKSKIHAFEYSTLIFTSFLSMFFGIGTYLIYKSTNNDTPLIALIGMVVSIIVLYIIKTIIVKNNEGNIYELNKNLVGKFLGNAINLVLFIGYFGIAVVILCNLAEFFNTEYLIETSIDYVKILLLIPMIYVAGKDINTIIKVNQIFSIISFLLIIISFLGILSGFEYENIEPIGNANILSILKTIGIYIAMSVVSYSMLLVSSKRYINDNENLNKNLNRIFLIANIIQIVIIFATLFILGAEYISIFRFPEYIALKQFQLMNILERVENILSLQFYFNTFSFLSTLYYLILSYIPKTKLEKWYGIILALLQFIVSKFIFKNTLQFTSLIESYLVYFIILFIFLPIIITFIALKIKDIKNDV